MAKTPKLLLSGAGDSTWFLGHLFTIKLSAEQTGGRFSLLDHVVAPLPVIGAPPHVHHGEDEAWYVLEGRLTFRIGEETVEAPAGSTVFAPKGIPHWFNNPAPGPARVLVLLWPAGFERFFFELGEPARAATLPPTPPGPPDIDRLVSVGRKYNLELLPPQT